MAGPFAAARFVKASAARTGIDTVPESDCILDLGMENFLGIREMSSPGFQTVQRKHKRQTAAAAPAPAPVPPSATFCKVLLLPFLMTPGEAAARFLMVRGAQYNDEWSFITGGCRPSRDECLPGGPRACAFRELREETLGVVKPMHVPRHISMEVRDGTTFCAPCVYHVFLMPVDPSYEGAPAAYQRQLAEMDLATRFREAENAEIRWVSRAEMDGMPLWEFIRRFLAEPAIADMFQKREVPSTRRRLVMP